MKYLSRLIKLANNSINLQDCFHRKTILDVLNKSIIYPFPSVEKPDSQSGFGVTCVEDLRRRLREHVGVTAQSSPKIGGQRTKIKIIGVMIAKNQTFLSAWPTFKMEGRLLSVLSYH